MPKSVGLSLMLLLLMLANELSMQCLVNEREALLSFKQHQTNASYYTLSSWVGKDCCNWEGVECDNRKSHVVKINLSGNSLHGSIPTSFGVFKNLKELHLNVNKLHGMIPASLGNLSALEILRLDENELSGLIPESLSKLLNLSELHLSDNLFHGSIPTSFGDFPSLKELDLGYNKLGGSIPATLELYLSYNLFSGSIPASFGDFSNLEVLDLSGNRVSGVVPHSLGRLTELRVLQLNNNSLTGVLGESFFAKFHKLKGLNLGANNLSLDVRPDWVPPFQVTYISLHYCKLGPQFPKWLQTQTMVVDLNMRSAYISDSIPTWFENTSSSMRGIELSDNNIYGDVANLLKSFSKDNIFGYLDLSYNKITGQLPKNFGDMFLDVSILNLSNNQIGGSIPSSLCKMLYLVFLDFSKNHMSGEIPHCLGRLHRLHIIELSGNNLSGSIPSSIEQLSWLQRLSLGNNNFHGELPSTLRNCTRLTILDLGKNSLSGRIPTWIGESFVSLTLLNLRSNKYTGSMPQKLCYLNHLQVLDVAGNNLTGTIPHCFGNFTAMIVPKTDIYEMYSVNLELSVYYPVVTQVMKGREYEYSKTLELVINLDLSDNNFVGHIPQEITNLLALTSLNLSRNRLTGNIPKDIGRLTSLQSLDFSKNHLSGPIPESLSSISGLSRLNVSYNNLSGMIPKGTQIETLGVEDPFIFAGNHLLCGALVNRKCPGDETPQSPTYLDKNIEGRGDDLIGKWFYIGLTSGFVVGFGGVCGLLLLSHDLRCACFQFFDSIKDKLYVKTTVWILILKRRIKFGEDHE